MFGRRADAKLIRGQSRMRRFMPFISPRRNESLFYYAQEVEADAALRFIEEVNRNRSQDDQMTLFHLVLRAMAMAIDSQPQVNRFVAGGRIWQRNEIWITFSAKQELIDGAPLLTVKRRFEASESLDQMVDDILAGIRSRRRGKKTRSDREMGAALTLPAFVIRTGVWLLHKANMLGLLPKSMIDDDPLFTSLFVANLGSVAMESGYHHLWEYGTCSMFAVLGRVKPRWDGAQVFEIKYSYDERMADGMAGGIGMARIKEWLENPEKLR